MTPIPSSRSMQWSTSSPRELTGHNPSNSSPTAPQRTCGIGPGGAIISCSEMAVGNAGAGRRDPKSCAWEVSVIDLSDAWPPAYHIKNLGKAKNVVVRRHESVHVASSGCTATCIFGFRLSMPDTPREARNYLLIALAHFLPPVNFGLHDGASHAA